MKLGFRAGTHDKMEPNEEILHQLRLQLNDKTRRLDELEMSILQDNERLLKLGTIERLEEELKERDLIECERNEELRLLQEVGNLFALDHTPPIIITTFLFIISLF